MPRLEGVYEYRFVRPRDFDPEIDTTVVAGENTATYYARFVSAPAPLHTTEEVIEAFAARYEHLSDDMTLSELHRKWYAGASRTEERTMLVRRRLS